MPDTDANLVPVLERIAAALERLSPAPPDPVEVTSADAFVWTADARRLVPVERIAAIDLLLLKGIDAQAQTLLSNTRRFADGYPANNALLWGARGMGKSSLVKAVHRAVNQDRDPGPDRLALVEIHRQEIGSLGALLGLLRHDGSGRRWLLFCDDLSFDQNDAGYRSLKAVLEGGIEGRPDHVILYATSNRRHLMPRQMIENEQSTAIVAGEAVEEKVSLSDRFGLWLGFHACSQDGFLAMVDGYAEAYGLPVPRDRLHAEALAWAMGRGSRSGRVAWQFVQDLAGRLGMRLEPVQRRSARPRPGRVG